jgi:hypothetical protein
LNLGGSDYVKVWTPWCERFLWLPERIKLIHPTVVGDRAVYKWAWLRTVYYRTGSWTTVLSDIGTPAVVEIEYAMDIFDILRRKD